MANVSFCTWRELWDRYEGTLLDLARRNHVSAVAELGGGANPIIASSDWDFVPERVVLDISESELAKASTDVEKRAVDLCGPVPDRDRYDLVFSKLLCEHLVDARSFHRNCFQMLRPGGRSVHMYSTLYAFPFVVNKLVPDRASRFLLSIAQPFRKDDGKMGKFPATYNWCEGPVPAAFARYESVGFDVETWAGAFGHTYYERVPFLDHAERAKARLLIRHPVNHLTTFAMVTLRKPTETSARGASSCSLVKNADAHPNNADAHPL